jgi:hypothetical protein
MCADPVIGDVNPPGDPDIVCLGDVIEEAFEIGRAARPSDDARVQPNAHHLGQLLAFPPQKIEGLDQIGGKTR